MITAQELKTVRRAIQNSPNGYTTPALGELVKTLDNLAIGLPAQSAARQTIELFTTKNRDRENLSETHDSPLNDPFSIIDADQEIDILAILLACDQDRRQVFYQQLPTVSQDSERNAVDQVRSIAETVILRIGQR